jgi:spore maturation protein CgeB
MVVQQDDASTGMRLVVFGLAISSSWGNGHATLWRGLCKALHRRGHRVVFFERDVPYYAANRDLAELPGGELVLYRAWDEVLARAGRELQAADAVIVTSFCPDGAAAAGLLTQASHRALTVFYDMDTPVTLDCLRQGNRPAYVGPQGLRDFDLVLSFTGDGCLDELRALLGARKTATLYGHVDPDTHHPVEPVDAYRCALSYLGTYAADRQAALHALFIEPARQRPDLTFLIGGAQYPADFPWSGNLRFVQHMPPPLHPAFFCSSRLTLSVTRQVMAANGDCPSGRLFEAAACGTPIVSDWWPGLDEFLLPGQEVLVAERTEDVLQALQLTDAELQRIATAARERVLAQHTSAQRARELEELLEQAREGDAVLSNEGD